MVQTPTQESAATHGRQIEVSAAKPRLGFLGVGWIGRHRLAAVAESQCAQVAAIADGYPEAVESAKEHAPDAIACDSLDQLLEHDLDGLVIATPSALHAEQTLRGLERGLAVFCQKPLARTARETRQVVEQARTADRLLGVDLSYRFVTGVPEMRRLVRIGELGTLYAVELTFHNAYGPDKPWFYDPALAGGGCLMDLGTHLVDLAFWFFEGLEVKNLSKQIFHQGQPVSRLENVVEDFAWANWQFENGPAVRLACSWGISAGTDAVIEAVFHGTNGAVALRNVAGSFYDFLIEHYRGRDRRVLAKPPDAWGGRALIEWCRRLGRDNRFDPSAEHFVKTAELMDRIYDR